MFDDNTVLGIFIGVLACIVLLMAGTCGYGLAERGYKRDCTEYRQIILDGVHFDCTPPGQRR